MGKVIQAIRGMSDIVPAQAPYWQAVEGVAREVVKAYGYEEIRLPVLERTELFRRSIGEVTDIVEKEMYTFTDRSGDSLTMRPEGTAGCVRAGIEHGLLRGGAQRWWYTGPMFRHERPQKGRYRQFHQIGVEAFGISGPEIDAEMILMTSRLWRRLGLTGLRLELNSLGSTGDRALYRKELVDYFTTHSDELDDDSLRRLESNPLRILDSKNPEMRPLIEGAPTLLDHLGPESDAHFRQLCRILDGIGVSYSINPRLVRGLDYYTDTVFEWMTDALGAQGTVCAGGRYDDLVSQFGGPDTPAVGFAIGLERLIAMLQVSEFQVPDTSPQVYFVAMGEAAGRQAAIVAESLRDTIPALRLVMDGGKGSLKGKLKRADRSGARFALILGDNEVESGQVGVKNLREKIPQTSLAHAALGEHLESELFGGGPPEAD